RQSHTAAFQTEDLDAYDSDCDDISSVKAVLMVTLSSCDLDVLFETEDLDAYDSDSNDLSSAKAVLMANLSSYDLDVLSEVPYSDSSLNDMINQDVQEMQCSEQIHIDDFQDNKIHSDSNIITYS
nr:hypothetical protein [Tanacetum cinerariifolium]